jgi:putative endonuclease
MAPTHPIPHREPKPQPAIIRVPFSECAAVTYWVYILASRSRVLYIGVTSNLQRRLAQHREGGVNAFTARYHVHRLVYCEPTDDAHSALRREKQLEGWRRMKKLDLVESVNPDWKDLSPPSPG